MHTHIFEASQVALVVKNPPANAGDARGVGSIPGSGRSLGVGNGSLVQYSCLENSMGIGAWQVIVHGATNPIWCNFQFFINGILLTYSETCYFSHSVVLKIMYIDIFRCSSILHCMTRPRVSLEQGFHIFWLHFAMRNFFFIKYLFISLHHVALSTCAQQLCAWTYILLHVWDLCSSK